MTSEGNKISWIMAFFTMFALLGRAEAKEPTQEESPAKTATSKLGLNIDMGTGAPMYLED